MITSNTHSWFQTTGPSRISSTNSNTALHINSSDARADSTKDVVGNGPCHPCDLLGIQVGVALGSKQGDRIAGSERSGMGEINSGEVHGDGAQNRRKFTVGNHFATIRHAVKDAIGITGPENPDAHGTRGAEGSAVSHQGPFGNLF